MCSHESVGAAQDGSGLVLCWDCSERFIAWSTVTTELDRLVAQNPDVAYRAVIEDVREALEEDDGD